MTEQEINKLYKDSIVKFSQYNDGYFFFSCLVELNKTLMVALRTARLPSKSVSYNEMFYFNDCDNWCAVRLVEFPPHAPAEVIFEKIKGV